MTETMLEARGVAAGYGRKRIVHGVDLAVAKGEILLVLGHNGAGKTTLMRALFGLLPPDEGSIRYEGRDIAGRSPAEHGLDVRRWLGPDRSQHHHGSRQYACSYGGVDPPQEGMVTHGST